MWIVFTEIHNENGVERWYYGKWSDRDRANEVALELGGEWPIYHCVCAEADAEKFGIQNLNSNWQERRK